MTIDQFFRGFTGRMWFLLATVLVSQGALVGRLWYEQVQRGPEHRERIVQQSIRRERLPPVRGRIFSRDGVALADNVPSYEVLFHRHEMRQPRRGNGPSTDEFMLATIERTALLLGRQQTLDWAALQARLMRHKRVYPALPFRAFSDLSEAEMARLHALMPGMPGMEIRTRGKRIYPLGNVGAHWLGYTGLIPQSHAPEGADYDYFLPEVEGYTGLEDLYDTFLSGSGGMRLMLVDTMGVYHEQIALVKRPELGHNLVLTIDSRAQKIAQALISDVSGSLVALDVRSGAVLAMASSPSYQLGPVHQERDSDGVLQTFVGNQPYPALRDNPEKPLQNRAILAGYNCGSIIKPLIALSALEKGTITPETIVNCPGYYQLGNQRIRCSARWGHGEIDLAKAIEVSCNTYFIDIGIETGVDHLELLLASAGIGQTTGLELDTPFDEGLLPSRDEKLRRRGEAWYAADTAFISIGQGFIGVSPLQAAVFTAAIANDGLLMRPHLLKAVESVDGRPVVVTRPDVRGQLLASGEHLQFIREAMHRVVWGEDASATTAQSTVIDLAGKTGTAEVGPRDRRYKNTWFICFGPYEAPRYAVCVFVEHGISGGKSAAPIARKFLETFLLNEDSE